MRPRRHSAKAAGAGTFNRKTNEKKLEDAEVTEKVTHRPYIPRQGQWKGALEQVTLLTDVQQRLALLS